MIIHVRGYVIGLCRVFDLNMKSLDLLPTNINK